MSAIKSIGNTPEVELLQECIYFVVFIVIVEELLPKCCITLHFHHESSCIPNSLVDRMCYQTSVFLSIILIPSKN